MRTVKSILHSRRYLWQPGIALLLFVFSVHLNAGDLLADYLKTGAENNPGLKAAYYRYLATAEKIPQVGSLPDPQVSFGYFLEPMPLMMGNQVAQVQVMQMFPWFGTLQAAESEAGRMAGASFEMFRQEKALLFFRIKVAYYNLYKLQSEQIFIRENLKILHSIEQISRIKFTTGSISAGSGPMVATMTTENQPSTSAADMDMSMGSNTSTAGGQ